MNADQVAALVRILLSVSGPLGGWLVYKKVVTPEQLPGLTAAIITLITVVPPAVSAIWSVFFVHTDSAKIAAVTAMPDVKAVVVKPSAPANSAAAEAAADPAQPKVTK